MSNNMFNADNFTRTDIGYNTADCGLPILQAMGRSHFPGWIVTEALQLDRNEINSGNYQVALELPIGEKKRVLVREYKVLRDVGQINFYLEFLAELHTRGVRVSRIYKTSGGALFAQADGKTYAVFEFIDATHFVTTEQGFASVAKEVATMHLAFEAIGGGYISSIEVLSKQGNTFFNAVPSVLVSDLELIKTALEQKKEHTETDALIYSKLPQYSAVALQIDAMRVRAESYQKQIFHSDLHPHNILMQKGVGEVGAIVDFDSLRVQQLGEALDVAYAVYRLGRQFLVGQRTDTEEAKKYAVQLRELFVSSYVSVKPLSNDEIESLPLLCKEEMMKKLIYLLKGAYLGDKTPWLHDLPKFISAIDEIDYFWE